MCSLDDLYPGRTVKITNWVRAGDYRPEHWAEDGEMDEWAGEVVEIAYVNEDTEEVYIKDDDGNWQWYPSDFELLDGLDKGNPNVGYRQNYVKRAVKRFKEFDEWSNENPKPKKYPEGI